MLGERALAMLPPHVTILRPLPTAPVYANAGAAQVMVAASTVRYDAALMQACPALRLIARTGIGVDNVDLAAATAHGVVVVNTPDGPTESTAEHTVAMLLALAKRLKQGNANLAAGQWGPIGGPLLGDEVQGKTLAIVGAGRIGRRVAQICRLAFTMPVLGYDPYTSAQELAALGIEAASLERVLAEADFVSLHAPATPETYHLINHARLALMKPTAYLLNLARGPLVDEAALLAALDGGRLAGAGLDVFDPEPLPLTSPLRNHPLVVATPHIASSTREGRERMETMAIARVLAFFDGQRPPDVVNPEVYAQPERMRG